MNLQYLPEKGSRFQLHDNEFEIQYVHGSSVRYSSVKGGKTHHLSIDDFNKFKSDGRIEITFQAKQKFHEGNIGIVIRRRRYIEPIIKLFTGKITTYRAEKIIIEVANFLNEPRPSIYTVKAWISSFKLYGNAGLIPKANGNRSSRYGIQVELIINEEVMKATQKGLAVLGTEVYANIIGRLTEFAAANGIENLVYPGLRTIQRRINDLDPYRLLMARHGKHAAKRNVRASGAKSVSPSPLSIVEIDSHEIDVILIDPDTQKALGRAWLILIICVYSRLIVGYFVSLYPPSACTTLAAMKKMLLSYGVPAVIIPDRGMEFKNTAMFHLCDQLITTLELSQPRNPNHKAHVESFFKTISKALFQRMQGTTYSNVIDRGDYDSEKNAFATLAQTNEYLKSWIDEVYHVREHTQSNRIPIQVWNEYVQETPPLILASDEIENLAGVPHKAVVNKGRLLFDYLYYSSHVLTQYEGEELVFLVNELDLNEIRVKDPRQPGFHFKATSIDPNYTKNLTIHQHKLARKEIKDLAEKDKKTIGEYTHIHGLYLLNKRMTEDAKSNKKDKRKAANGAPLEDVPSFQNIEERNSVALVAIQQTVELPPSPVAYLASSEEKNDETRQSKYKIINLGE